MKERRKKTRPREDTIYDVFMCSAVCGCRVEYMANAASDYPKCRVCTTISGYGPKKMKRGSAVLDKVLQKIDVKQIRNEILRRIRLRLELLTRRAYRMRTQRKKKVMTPKKYPESSVTLS